MARILVSRGVKKVKGVILIDSPPPTAPPLLSDGLIRCILRDMDDQDDRERTIADSSLSTQALVARQFKRSTELLGKFALGARDAEQLSTFNHPVAFLRCTAGFCPGTFEKEERECVPAWFRERSDVERTMGPWEEFVGGPIQVWDVPGHHFEPFSRVRVSLVLLGCACFG